MDAFAFGFHKNPNTTGSDARDEHPGTKMYCYLQIVSLIQRATRFLQMESRA